MDNYFKVKNGLDFATPNRNLPIGSESLSQSTGAGSDNIAIGASAMYAVTTGSYNTAIGSSSLGSITTQISNTAIGHLALRDATGNQNTAVGSRAMRQTTSGQFNTAVGCEALLLNTSGDNNVAVGMTAMYSNNTGRRNVAVGSDSLFYCVSASANTAVGSMALYYSTGNRNTAVGMFQMFYNTTGSHNTSVGYYALQYNTTGNYNTAVGHRALEDNLGGAKNVGIGFEAAKNSTGGSYNIAIGTSPMLGLTSGNGNIAIGTSPMTSLQTGNDNIALGYQAGSSTTGSKNIFIGYQAGSQETGSDKLYISNTDSTIPLVFGNFSASTFYIHGTFVTRFGGGKDAVVINPGTTGTAGRNVTLTPASLTGSRTLTLPDTTGTVITTGDTGTVTSTMIADGTIVNVDVSASAAIALSKLASGTAGQLVVHNASGVPTATTVTGDVTIDSSGVTAIGSGVIANADISSTAAIELNKLADVTIDRKTSGYTLASTDKNKIIEMDVSSAHQLAVPLNTTSPLPVGTEITIIQQGAGKTQIAGAVGVTLRSTPGLYLRAQYSSATLIKRATDEWYVIGDLSAT